MSILYLLLALLAFSVLIVGHEFGHFIVAKLNNVKVEEFSVGMGPKLLGIKGKETEYCIRAIPLGGYVKMLGEQGEDSKDARAFNNKKPLQRLAITSAGPIMNFILAVIFFAIISSINGVAVPIVSKVVQKSPAYIQGIHEGDKIVKVDGKKIGTWDEFVQSVGEKNGKKLELTLMRKSKLVTKTIEPVKVPEENRYIIGIYPSIKKVSVGEAISHGFSEIKSIVKMTFDFLGKLFTGKVSANGVGGPISVFRISTKAAQSGLLSLLTISAYISVQLAIFNLLPIPALDGGWILFSLIEIVIGKKLNDEIVGKLNYVGFVFLLTLVALVTIKDILYPLKL
ncbi:RIP metalloprotease RseP [Haloimpatiens sp. FM7330]|uniref:RIP metalloprotease RseP n=1 Tax=Haloimpatiens sp. FM7330 TaxID=3298610 RepID=UPI003628B797